MQGAPSHDSSTAGAGMNHQSGHSQISITDLANPAPANVPLSLQPKRPHEALSSGRQTLPQSLAASPGSLKGTFSVSPSTLGDLKQSTLQKIEAASDYVDVAHQDLRSSVASLGVYSETYTGSWQALGILNTLLLGAAVTPFSSPQPGDWFGLVWILTICINACAITSVVLSLLCFPQLLKSTRRGPLHDLMFAVYTAKTQLYTLREMAQPDVGSDVDFLKTVIKNQVWHTLVKMTEKCTGKYKSLRLVYIKAIQLLNVIAVSLTLAGLLMFLTAITYTSWSGSYREYNLSEAIASLLCALVVLVVGTVLVLLRVGVFNKSLAKVLDTILDPEAEEQQRAIEEFHERVIFGTSDHLQAIKRQFFIDDDVETKARGYLSKYYLLQQED